ncbi:MAG: anthranilate phosphoribosyltransferase [Oceanipulchritudo sp.]
MSALTELTRHLRAGLDLPEADCTAAARLLPRADVDPAEKKAFLLALHEKRESIEEITAFAKVFRQLATDPKLSDLASEAIDIVGTGGSGSGGFNLSSTTAMLVAASGTRVLKHGNRAITSRSGAADFLTAHGIRMDTDPGLLRAAIEELDFCFFFAPAFHPAFKEIMPVRKELAAQGKPTVFNILGPLINPAKPAYQLLGVFFPAMVKPLAGALGKLGLARGLAVCSELPGIGNMDEFTTAGVNHVVGFGGMAGTQGKWKPDDVGFPPADPAELIGGTAAENMALLEDILRGDGRQGLADSIILNAAAAFLIVEKVDSLGEGCALAREILYDGTLAAWLEKARAFYQSTGPGA